MKRTGVLALILSALLLTSCAPSGTGGEEDTTSGIPDSSQVALEAAKAETDYYRRLVESLQAELLVAKSTMASSEEAYEARIRELEVLLGLPDPALHPDYRISLCEGGVMITEYIGSDTAARIPERIGDAAVVAIGDRAFENNLTLTEVVIPEGVREIGWFSFAGCIKLTSVTLPASLRSVEYGCFQNCPSALSVVCPAGSYAEKYANSYGIFVKRE